MSSIKLGFFGSQKVEILMYLARILKNLNLKVLVIDASLEQNLKFSVPNSLKLNEIEYRDIKYFIERDSINMIKSDDYSDFDYILMDFGFNYSLVSELTVCDQIFLITDFNKFNVYRTKKFVEKIIENNDELKLVRIFKDYISGNIKKKYIDHLIFNGNEDIIIGKYEFPLLEKEVQNKYSSQYMDIFKINKISKELASFLKDILFETTQKKEKEIDNAFKLARKGK